MPLVGRTGVFSSQQCDPNQSVHEGDPALPPLQPASLPAVTMAAVSPDGGYLAIVTAGQGDLYVGKRLGQATSFSGKPRLSGGGITSLSWDRDDDLWVAQGGGIYKLPSTGKAVQVAFGGTVTDLAVAPDGVRIAFIAQVPGSSPGLYLAAIGGGPSASGQLGAPGAHLAITDAAAIGPGLTHPASLAWYDADDLLVLNDAADGNTLMGGASRRAAGPAAGDRTAGRDLDHRRRPRERPGSRTVRKHPGRLHQPGRPLVSSSASQASLPPTPGNPRPHARPRPAPRPATTPRQAGRSWSAFPLDGTTHLAYSG